MPSKQVNDREKSNRAVVAAAQSHGHEIGKAVATTLTPYLEKNESMPDVELLVRLIGRALRSSGVALANADAAHAAELGDDTTPREQRDAAAESIRSVLVDLRDAVATAYGAAGLRKLGLAEVVPVDPTALATKAHSVREALLSNDVKLPAPRRAALKIDRKGFATELGADLPALETALETVAREQREAAVTQAAKNDAMATHDKSFSRYAGLIAALAASGGLDALAGTIRPSVRRPGKTASEVEDAEENAAGE